MVTPYVTIINHLTKSFFSDVVLLHSRSRNHASCENARHSYCIHRSFIVWLRRSQFRLDEQSVASLAGRLPSYYMRLAYMVSLAHKSHYPWRGISSLRNFDIFNNHRSYFRVRVREKKKSKNSEAFARNSASD
jgi:hypothetical protein